MLLFRNFAFFALLAVCNLTLAEVYTWVDENGKTHFSDRKPAHLEDRADLVEVSSAYTTGSSFPKVAQANPIFNPKKDESKVVFLETVALNLPEAANGETLEVGRAFKYTPEALVKARKLQMDGTNNYGVLSCEPDGNLSQSNARYIIGQTNFDEPFYPPFEQTGYKTPNQARLFARQESVAIDLSLAAIIVDTRVDLCGQYQARNLNSFTQNSTYLKVEWQLFDNLTRQVVFSATTEGADEGLHLPPRKNGAIVSMQLAFKQATEHLLSKEDFVAALKTNVQPSSVNQNSVFNPIDISFGNSSKKFHTQIESIKNATVTVRTVAGNGSGFVISPDGYVITNQHVVGSSSSVLLMINGTEYRAAVIHSDPRRDVALLKISDRYPGDHLNIHPGKVSLAEPIFVIGTPLDEKLEFSITQGIISAERNLEGLRYYQTDAAINPGNSGGPVFNNLGNVVAITVSGIFSSDGGSKNINFLIPIDEALSALGIKKP